MFGEAVVPDEDYADFSAYLEALGSLDPTELRGRYLRRIHMPDSELPADGEAFTAQLARLAQDERPDEALVREAQALLNDPPALRRLIVDHLRELWNNALAEEWKRQLRNLSGLPFYLRQPPLPPGTAAETIRAFINRELPDAVSAQLDGVRRVVFVLSPHVRLHAARFGSPDTIWVFVLGRFWDHAILRRELFSARLLDRTPDGARYWRTEGETAS